jgi:Xaa-Pro aminopeptidase
VLDAARPGAVCADLEAAWRRVISPRGIEPAAYIGYTVGIGFAPTWGELTASLRPGNRTVLAPGMTFHCIPVIWREDGTIVISESFEVTGAGGKAFADVPHAPFSKP